MIPWEPRRGWLRIGLASLEMLCLVPVLFALHRPLRLDALAVWVGLWVVQCLWILAVDLLSAAQADAPEEGQSGSSEDHVAALIFASILVSSVILVRVLLYPTTPLGQFTWIGAAMRGLVSFEEGIGPELLVILTNILLWQRALQSGTPNLHFHGLTARVRRLWSFSLGAAVYVTLISPIDLLPPALAAFPIGLMCLVVGRSDEKATAAGSVGRPLRWWHMAELAIVVLAVWGFGLMLSAAPTAWLVSFLDIVFGLILLGVLQVLLVLVFLLYPVVLEIVGFFMRAFDVTDVTPPSLEEPGAFLSEEIPLIRAIEQLPPWALDLLRIGALVLVLMGAALLVTIIWRAARPRRYGSVQRERSRWALPDGSFLRQGLARVQDVLALARQIGIGQQLLAATSVRNIYANLTRMATQRGYPRQKHQPPDRYVDDMARAFVGFEQPLQRITAAYMRVHYGDHPIERAELEQIQSDYREIRDALQAGSLQQPTAGRPQLQGRSDNHAHHDQDVQDRAGNQNGED
jgi:hypothetical protein